MRRESMVDLWPRLGDTRRWRRTTLPALGAARQERAIRAWLARHGGRVVVLVGDGR